MTNPFDELRHSSSNPSEQLDHSGVQRDIDERIAGIAPGSAPNRRPVLIAGGVFSGVAVAGVAVALAWGTGVGASVPEVARPTYSSSSAVVIEPAAFFAEAKAAIDGAPWVLETHSKAVYDTADDYTTSYVSSDGKWSRSIFNEDNAENSISSGGDEDLTTPNDDGTDNRYMISPENNIYTRYLNSPSMVAERIRAEAPQSCAERDADQSLAECLAEVEVAAVKAETEDVLWTPSQTLADMRSSYEMAAEGEATGSSNLIEPLHAEEIDGVEAMCFSTFIPGESMVPDSGNLEAGTEEPKPLDSEYKACFDPEQKLPIYDETILIDRDGTRSLFTQSSYIWHPHDAEAQKFFEPNIEGMKSVAVQEFLDRTNPS